MDTQDSRETLTPDTDAATKPSRAKKIVKATGQLTGASVLLKDAKRMRPRYPSMWRDLASPQKWVDATRHRATSKQPIATTMYTVALSWLVGIAVIFYAVAFLNNDAWLASAPVSSRLALLVLVALAGLQIVTYTTILGIKIKRLSNQAPFGNPTVNKDAR